MARTDSQVDVVLVTSQGGHLTHLLALEPWWSRRTRTWVCPDTEDVRDRLGDETRVTSFGPTTRHLPNLLRNLRLAVTTLRRCRPRVLVSTGAGLAVPFFVVAWWLRIPTVFIEVYDRVDSPTLTGRLCRPFTSRRVVQWDAQLDHYPDAALVGTFL
ncbi:UDP-N-acetylglucosamine--LPS N-acetylglucosamine transferase [Marmoricola sp. RAF53]|uniref:UDP-N-acetylglucosamine--LPS N-acetylglucosamine transferase n=1 Tax=Marmoricola sp. RAF53 TaxID=3233059 RepID=UPI003F9B8C61